MAEARVATVWRGERGGALRTNVTDLYPCFFAEARGHAELYGGPARDVHCCVIQAERVLDLTDIDYRDPAHKALLAALEDRFEDWIDRTSGQSMAPADFLEAGTLYGYEGTGSGTRWHAMFDLAFDMGFDAVRALDSTDFHPPEGGPAVVWVVNRQETFRLASAEERAQAEFEALQANEDLPEAAAGPRP